MITHWHVADAFVSDHRRRLEVDARCGRLARQARRAKKAGRTGIPPDAAPIPL